MLFDACIRRVDEELFEVSDVHIDAIRDVPVRPMDFDVVRMALVQPRPFLIREYVEVERIERRKMGATNFLGPLKFCSLRRWLSRYVQHIGADERGHRRDASKNGRSAHD